MSKQTKINYLRRAIEILSMSIMIAGLILHSNSRFIAGTLIFLIGALIWMVLE